ncbi:hypothetical protein ANCCAN_28277 [Ancylostoma caninum]|uniref:Adenosylmethionine decarboxylase n=1 Tax=Ancylostoma caninum TaxID=29170 RepID=A0A368F537_ANCCA|nr:hypothetical protein ANCCAN_28277 [Ancylostoma caninum]
MTDLDEDVLHTFTKDACENGKVCPERAGISRIVPKGTLIHEELFDPCGYSMNAFLPDSKTTSKIDELCNIVDDIIKKEKGTEVSKRKTPVCEEPEAEKMAQVKIREDESKEEHSEEISQQDQSLKKAENVPVSLQ